MYLKNTSAWHKHLIKVKRVLRISYFPLLIMINRPIKPGQTHFAELIPPTRAEITDRISVQILHISLYSTCSRAGNATHTCSWPWLVVYKNEMEVAGWPSGYRDLPLSERSQVLSRQTASVYPSKAVYPLQMSFSKTLNRFLLTHCHSDWQPHILKVKTCKHWSVN